MREVEFLPEWYPKVRKRRRVLALQAWVTLILVCGLGLWMLLVQRNVRAQELTLAHLGNDLRQSETECQRLDELLALQRQLGQQDQIFVKIGRPVESTHVITTLAEIMPPHMALLGLSLDTQEQPIAATGLSARAQAEKKEKESKLNFRLHGVAPTDVDLAEFLAKLTARPFLKRVELIYSHERQDSGRVMREFEVAFAMDLPAPGVH
jgi:Tfp pilus assembly protein PilN